MVSVRELIMRNRSYRRFDEGHAMAREQILELVEYGRLSPSGANKQPLKYLISVAAETNQKIFSSLLWAAYLTEWEGPAEGERPGGYVIILGDKKIGAAGVDYGIAAQSILLGAVELGLGGCMIQNIRRQELRRDLQIPEDYEILLVIALGKPVETIVLEAVGADGDIKYWRDEAQRHHVPKRTLDEVVLKVYG